MADAGGGLPLITISHTLVAEKPIAEVYALFHDMATLTRCVPQCQDARIIDADHFTMHLALKLGIILLESNAHMTVIERVPPHRLVTTGVAHVGQGLAQAAHLTDNPGETRLKISFTLQEQGTATTAVNCQIEADAVGNLKRVYEGIIRGQRAKLEASFVENVRQVLACPVVLAASGAEFDTAARR